MQWCLTGGTRTTSGYEAPIFSVVRARKI